MERADIINLEQYGDALRSTGYKNIESAVAEIVDNSLEAEANDVLIIVTDRIPSYASRRYVTEIAFLDNGTGMDKQLVQSCLRIGYGTKRDRRGIGRFGVGLPQSSLHACPLVEVYSWQDGIENCYKSYLDIVKIKNGEQKYFDEPIRTAIPDKYEDYIKCNLLNKSLDFSQHGTLVVWKECDNVSPKTVKPLFDRLEFYLGQKFRYLIHDYNRNIHLVNVDNEYYNRTILPNDPLMLLDRNLVLGNLDCPGQVQEGNLRDFTVPLFEPFGNEMYPSGELTIDVKYHDRETMEIKEGPVKLKFSVIKREFYDQDAIAGTVGTSPMGKHAAKLEGITVVRANREIDFGDFDFYSDKNEPEHRWWGCEINFMPELDELFGVSNNKQHVELIRQSDEEYEEDEVKPIWLQLKPYITTAITNMKKRNELIRKGSRPNRSVNRPSEEIIHAVEQENPERTPIDELRERTPIEEVQRFAEERLREQGLENPSQEEVNRYVLSKVKMDYRTNGRAPFFDYEMTMGFCICTINIDHIFYKKFLTHIESDTDAKVAFELFIASLIITIAETTDNRRNAYDDLISEWNEKLRKYINKQYGENQF